MYEFLLVKRYDSFYSCYQYGILQREYDMGSWRTAACIPDIACNEEFVTKLITRCSSGLLSPVHLLDVVMDSLP
ncbi:MAG: hypothetical protein KH009_04625 [Clostridiales bacterium]|nr:hypothetical protein [Clostridiales bacterium]